MAHVLIVGQTMSGKTTGAIQYLQKIREATGRPLIVLDPNLDPRWNADFITDNKEEFLEMVFSNSGCEIAIDESGESVGRYAKDMMPLATKARHYGHRCTFICQRAQQLDTNVREQCTTLLCFSVAKKSAESLAEEFVDDMLLEAPQLQKGEYILKRKFKPAIKLNAFVDN